MRSFRAVRSAVVVAAGVCCVAGGLASATAGELLLNGDFAIDSAGKPMSWVTHDTLTAVTTRDTTVYHSAPACAKMVGLPHTTRIMLYQDFSAQFNVPPAVPNDTLVIAFYTRGQRLHHSLQVVVEGGNWQSGKDSYRTYFNLPCDTTWKRLSFLFLDTIQNNFLRIHFDTMDSAVVWVDDASILRKSDVAVRGGALSVRPSGGVRLTNASLFDLQGREQGPRAIKMPAMLVVGPDAGMRAARLLDW